MTHECVNVVIQLAQGSKFLNISNNELQPFKDDANKNLIEYSKRTPKQIFFQYIWACGILDLMKSELFDKITEAFFLKHSNKPRLIDVVNLKDISAIFESFRLFCKSNKYNSKLVDVLFKKLLESKQQIEVKHLVSLLKSMTMLRYYDIEVMDYICQQCLTHLSNQF